MVVQHLALNSNSEAACGPRLPVALWPAGPLPCCATGGSLPGRQMGAAGNRKACKGWVGLGGGGVQQGLWHLDHSQHSVGHPCPHLKEELPVCLAAWRSQEAPQVVLLKGGPYEHVTRGILPSHLHSGAKGT